MRYGYFDDASKEYVITQPDTPLPWINYLGTEAYFGLISNTGGGYAFYRDARLRRITRYRYNNIPYDNGGRYIYLRDNETNNFWSPTWQPTRTPLDDYTCRHGLGYTIIQSTYQGIQAEIRYFVPATSETLEIWTVTVTNQRNTAADLSLFSFIEFALWDAQDDMTNFQRNFNTGQVEVEEGVIYHKTEYRERRDHFAYFATSEPMAGFDTQREEFLGLYHGLHDPQVVIDGQSRNSMAAGWAPIGSHHIALKLEAGESKQLNFLLGYHENPREEKFDPPQSQTINKANVKPLIQKYLDLEQANCAFADLARFWEETLGSFQVATPDEHVDRMVNIWNAYQCMVTFNLSRSASYFESGVGRGMGFRDSNQDLLGFVHMAPARARERLLDIAATQLKSGGAYHQYQPLTKRGNDAVGSNFNDDPLWLVLAVAAYIKETGDWSILDEPVQYENEAGSEQPLYNHVQRSIQYTLNNIGSHGLPLIGRADWNDCLNLNTFSSEPGESFQTTTNMDGKVAESVFIAGLFVLAAQELAQIADHYCPEDSATLRESAQNIERVVEEHGWDGEWFLRAYDHYSRKIGSSENTEGRIFIEPQGLCILAGIGKQNGMAQKALDSVRQHLATEHGIVLQQPAFSQYYLHLGEISSYPPGYKENAGVFCHTNPWIMIAEAIMGHGDNALDYYKRICPSAREAISDIHRSEPYVYAQMIAGRDAQTFGEAKNSWLTGTAAWNYVAIAHWILGIRADFDGLRIEPVIPQEWQGFSATRSFRDVTYTINVKRIGAGNNVTLTLDGEKIDSTVIPYSANGALAQHVVAEIG